MKIHSAILLSGLALCGCAQSDTTKSNLAALEKKVAALEASSKAQQEALQKLSGSGPSVAGKPHGFPEFDDQHSIVLSAGQSVILARGQKAKVPYGTSVVQPGPGGRAVTLNGQMNTIDAGPGVIVTVPANASGPADNLVIVK